MKIIRVDSTGLEEEILHFRLAIIAKKVKWIRFITKNLNAYIWYNQVEGIASNTCEFFVRNKDDFEKIEIEYISEDYELQAKLFDHTDSLHLLPDVFRNFLDEYPIRDG